MRTRQTYIQVLTFQLFGFWLAAAAQAQFGAANPAEALPPADEPAATPEGDESVKPAKLASGQLAPADDSQPATNSTLIRLAKDYDIWIDPKRKLVVVDGHICLREGQLEMFACPRGTKEHESVVAVNCRSQFIHAALLAVGAQPGRPVQFSPEYVPASGPVVDVLVLWVDENGKRHKRRAQEWVQNVRTEQEMAYDWVFAGSGFWTDEEDGRQYYYADGGELICVSNFSTAMMDVPVQSSQDTAELLFAAFTERIPPLGTKVRLVLIPRPGETPTIGPSSQTSRSETPPHPRDAPSAKPSSAAAGTAESPPVPGSPASGRKGSSESGRR